jgi:hypothetical protein
MGTWDFAHETESGTVRPAARKELAGALSEGEKENFLSESEETKLNGTNKIQNSIFHWNQRVYKGSTEVTVLPPSFNY